MNILLIKKVINKMSFARAYVQGDWVASEVCETTGHSKDNKIGSSYTHFLYYLAENGVDNTATWHQQGQGVIDPANKKRSTDALRNCREVDAADCVISWLQRPFPTSRHWGSISIMAYAVGRGKPCYVIADDDCIAWQSHFMHHPMIIRCKDREEVIAKLSG